MKNLEKEFIHIFINAYDKVLERISDFDEKNRIISEIFNVVVKKKKKFGLEKELKNLLNQEWKRR